MIYCSKYYLILFFFILVALLCCDTNNEHANERSGFKNKISGELIANGINNDKKQIDKNSYDQIGLYITGKKSENFAEIQQKDYYLNYVKKINQSWNETTAKNLTEIKKWNHLNFVTGFNDSATLFYPFSGPDFLYADAFFPGAYTYLMVGLENPGKLPNISKMDDQKRANYLNKLLHSLRYISQSGYFSTKQMMTDFADSSLNGIIHILLFYISKTGHSITEISALEINDYGNCSAKKNFQVEDKNPNGIKIRFYNRDIGKIKTLYYFPIDLSDENMKDNLGFLLFLSGFGQKNTFMKSASYILHKDDFQLIRKLILKQSKNILQDDSGIPYPVLKKSGYKLDLFGNYSRTLKTFSENFQANLQNALEEEGKGELNFKLGYNSWKNEMVLLLAEKKKKPVYPEETKESVVYKIQIKSSWKKIPEDSVIFKSLPPVDYYFRDGYYKYTIGNYSSEEECETFMKIAVKKGFTDAFVVAFYQKNRISLEEAEKLDIR